MIIQFDILAKIGIIHDYFSGNVVPSARFVPSKQSQKTMLNNEVRVKMKNGKLEVYIEVIDNEGKKQITDKIREPFALTFLVTFNDTFWSNYTDVLPEQNNVYYFSNTRTNTEDNSTKLHQDTHVNNEDQIRVKTGTLLTVNADSINQISLFSQGIDNADCSYAITQKEDALYIDTRMLDEGYYLMKTEDSEETFFLLKDELQADGIVHLIIHPENENYDPLIDKNWNLNHKEYTIHFKNRTTHWRYNFPKKQLDHFEGLRITNGSKSELFSPLTETIAPNGETMLSFTSLEEMELKMNPDQLLQLKKNVNIENRSEAVIISRLPCPNKENLYRVGEDGTIISDVFINL